ncbi:MAG: HigA family addiction module antidote protein [Bdellovibrionales bacterium]|nr:HigA family addiction module antidote protein [Bdellovibrionales bacterium]
MRPKNRPPRHPGDILQRIYLDDMGISQSELARHLGWKPGKVNEIVNKKRGITAETALAFADALNTTPEFWLNLQSNYDLWYAEKNHIKIQSIGA